MTAEADKEARSPRPRRENDGRVLRGRRNHEAILQAAHDLVRERETAPSVEEIAERAGVGVRTVFRQFEDLEHLYQALGERVKAELLAKVSVGPPTGDAEADLRALVGRRMKVYEALAPFRRAGRTLRHASSFLQAQDAETTLLFRRALEAALAPHLAGLEPDLVEALDALLSFETWDRLRVQQRLSPERTSAALLAAAGRLLG